MTNDPNDEMLRATRESQGQPMDAVPSSPEGRQEAAVLDAEELDTIETIARNDQVGRITPYEVRELLRGYRAYLSALPAPVAAVAPVAVKDLDWQTFCSSGNCAAAAFLGEYVIQYEDVLWELYLPYSDEHFGDGYKTLEAAKAAAQADFEARIRSALIPAKPAVEVVEAEWLRKHAVLVRELGSSMSPGALAAAMERRAAALQAPATPDAQPEGYAVCMWVDKPCTCGGGPCEQVSFGAGEPATPDAQTEVEK